MPVTHIFVGADSDHIADAATGNQFFELIIKSRVAQHMADDDFTRTLFRHFQNFFALAKLRRDGFFQKNMISFFQCGNGMIHMLTIHGGYHHNVGKLFLCQHLFSAQITVLFRNLV